MHKNTFKGVLFMTLAQIFFMSVWSAIKSIGAHMSPMEVAFFRGFFSLIVLIPMMLIRGNSFRGKDKKSLILRTLFGYAAMLLAFYTVAHMKIGNAVTIFNIQPIFIAMLAPMMIKEPLLKKQMTFICIAFIGIALIIKPSSGLLQNPVSLMALVASILAAFAMVFLRKLSKTDSIWTVTFYFTVFTTCASAILAFSHIVLPTSKDFALLIYIGFAVTFAQLFLTKAYRYASASTISPFGYTSVIMSYLVGMFFFSERPDLISILGACIVMVSGIGVILTAPKKSLAPGTISGARP